MNIRKQIIALALGAILVTTSVVMASEQGRKNTRNALGGYTIYSAIKGNKTGTVVGAAGTILAQKQLDKKIKQRHQQEAARRGGYSPTSHKHYKYSYMKNGRRYYTNSYAKYQANSKR